MSWQTRSIGDFVDAGVADIQTGPFGTQLRASDYVNEGTPVINVRNIGFGGLKPEKLEFVNNETAERLAAHLLIPNDIVFGRKGAVERHLLINEEQKGWMQGSDCIRLRFSTHEIVPRFVSYSFLAETHQKWMLAQSGNRATMASLNHDIIRRIPLSVPAPDIQRRIVDFLAVYDDLIENNRRRMVLLEEAARLLYREWFVRLRFPGHEHTRINNGVPEGWEKKTLADVCESVDYGYTASASDRDVGPKFLRITDIVPNSIDWPDVPYCEIEDPRRSKFRLAEGDIVVARTGATVGYAKRLHKRHPEAVFASYLVRFRLLPSISNLMVGVFVESPDYKSYVQSRVGGAAQPNANAKVLGGAEFLVPSVRLQAAFDEAVTPLFDQREVLDIQNQKLRAARDLLLPRLMSREITL